MADNRKTYEMLFALNAQMNSGFSGTFSKAQAEFSRLGKEIQGLQKIQGDIASYQKQQGAIAATSSKLESLQKQHDLLQREIGETKGSTASLERENVKLEQRIKDTETALERQKQKLQVTGERLKAAGVDTADLAQKDGELTAKIRELEAEQDKAAGSAASFGARSVQAVEAIQQAIAAAGIAAALKEIADAYIECVGIAGNLEETMSTVEALSQANAQEMAALTAEAKELGATTKFTAQEAGDAMGYMAMAGWDATDMLQGMDGVLQLAAASGEDLAMVSDIVTDSLSAFGLTAKDTAHFSDVLAAAATNSNTNVAIMGETFKMSASVAGALGYSIEDVAIAMGLMANSGVKGSIAGTALRNTFNGLLEGVTLTGAAFGEYEYSAVKADGTMKSFGATIDELRGYFERMTEAERVNNAIAIAGQRGYNGLLAVLNATDEDYASLAASINDCTGAAQRMAEVKLDNMNGQLTLMRSAWDALKTTIGEQFIPEMRTLYSIGTDVFGGLDRFVQKAPQLIKAGGSVVAVLGSAATGIMAVNAGIKAFRALDMAAAFASPIGQAVMLAAAIGAIAAASYELSSGADEAVEAWNDLIDVHQQAAQEYQDSISAIDDEASSTQGLVAQLQELSAKNEKTAVDKALILSLCDQLNEAVPELALAYDAETDSLTGLSDQVESYVEELYEAQKNEKDLARATELRGSVQETSAALEEATAALEKYQAEYDVLAASGGDLTMAQASLDTYRVTVSELTELLADEQAEYDELLGVLTEYESAAEESADSSEALADAIEGVAEDVAVLAASYTETYNAALESMQGQYALWDKAKDVTATSADAVNQALESQADYWRDYNADLQTLMDNASDVEGLSEMLASLDAGDADTVNFVAGLAEAAKNDKQALKDMVGNWQTAKQEQQEAAAAFAEYVEDFRGQMDGLQEELTKDIKAMDLGDEAKESGWSTIQGYIKGARDALPAVREAYGELGRAALTALSFSPTQIPNVNGYVSTAALRGFASGTDNAAPGLALVGEEGPELIYFNGGEKVLDAARTASLQARAAPAVSALPAPAANGSASPVQVTFQIQGNATPEVVQDLRGFADEIVGRVMDALEEADTDARRRAY